MSIWKPGSSRGKDEKPDGTRPVQRGTSLLYVALLLELHQRKVLRIEKWKTNRAYLREIAANNPEILSHMKELTGVFNACCYGNKEIDEACMNIWFQFYIEEKGKNEKQN